jgi:hypothetical protein
VVKDLDVLKEAPGSVSPSGTLKRLSVKPDVKARLVKEPIEKRKAK